jgi:hypothetical protein
MVNPMTTTGDTIYSSSGSTPARLAIGTTGQVLTVAGGVPTWATPAGGGGKVLQVVQATYSTVTTINSTSMTDTGLSVSITPSSATSKVLVLVTQQCRYYRNASTFQGVGMDLLRDSTVVFDMSGDTNIETNAIELSAGNIVQRDTYITGSYLDSPATTSAITYKTQGRVAQTTSNGGSEWNQAISSIICLEIGA